MNKENILIKKNKSKISTKMIALTGNTAAVYMVATLMIAPLSYGPIQFRFSEVLTLLAFIDPAYGPGLILGCALTNMFSPLGIIDVVVGTAATACSILCIIKSKNLFVASLWPSVFCVFIGAELWIIENLPFIATSLSIIFGEFVVVSCIGYPLFNNIVKNSKLMEILKIKK